MLPIEKKSNAILHKRINLLITHHKVNKLKLSRILGLSATYVGDMVRGVRLWNPMTIDRLVTGLGLDEREATILHQLGARAKGWRVPMEEHSE